MVAKKGGAGGAGGAGGGGEVPGHPKGWRAFSELKADGDKGQNATSKSVHQPARLTQPRAALIFLADFSFEAVFPTQQNTLSADLAFPDRDEGQKRHGQRGEERGAGTG